jgi:outer membrane protein assembly factor BamB
MALLLVSLRPELAAADAPNRPDAAAILAAIARPVGFVHLPRCGDGTLALALAKAAPSAYVQGQDADGAAVARARAAGSEAGVLNVHVGFDQADLARLLPAARSCDLVVLADLKSAELTPALSGEIARVLEPWYGVAVLGGPGVADAALKAWAGTIGSVTTDARLPGLVLAHAAPLAGADDWTHWWHGPDNNPLSDDHVFTSPETIQWMGKPYFASTLTQPIVAGGRCFVLLNGERREGKGDNYQLEGKATPKPRLLTLSTGSGAVLWTREMDEALWEQGGRSVLVAQAGRLMLAEGESVLVLDQATGGELARLDAKCGQICYLAATDGRLLVLGGPPRPLSGPNVMGSLNPKLFRTSGLALAAFALKDLSPVWRVQRDDGDQAFDPCSPAITGGRIITTTVGGRVESRELSDGTVVWTSAEPVTHRPTPEDFEWDGISRHPVSGFAGSGLYVSSGTGMENMAAFDLRDGSRRWKATSIPRTFSGLLFYGGSLISIGHVYDLKDGADHGEIPLVRGGCARLTGSPIGLFGADGFAWDAAKNAPAAVISAKSSCVAGTVVADGLAWKVPSECVTCTEWRGFLVRGPREVVAAPQPRLIVVDQKAAPPARETPPGWSTYRADARRSSACAATVPLEAAVAWKMPLRELPTAENGRMIDPELQCAPPVIAGQVVVVGDADGSLTAFALGDGHRLWRSLAGGRIWSSPTVWRDRVLVGCLDGTVSAFSLGDGHELWRLRVAPGGSRIPLFSQLGSRWPVLGSPLVVGDRAFAVAGLLDRVDGVIAVAFDPASGKLLWERSDWTAAGIDGVVSGAGQLCWDGTSVIYKGGESPLARLDPATGECLPVFGKPDTRVRMIGAAVMMKGQDVGALPDGTLVFGGRRLFTDQAEDGAPRNNTTYLVRDAAGIGRLPMPYQQEGPMTFLPSWDAREEVSFEHGEKQGRVALAPLPDLMSSLVATVNLPEVYLPNGPIRSFAPPKPLWSHETHLVRGLALTTNALVTLECPDWSHWTVSAFARDSGKQLWQFPIPMGPTHFGLAVAADGHVIVTLLDRTVMALGAAKPDAKQ